MRIPNWLGDLILAYPVLEAAALGPALFLGPEAFRDLLAPRFPSVTYLPVSRARRWSPAPAIRSARPRAALLLTESLSSALLAWVSGVPVRIGYAAEGRGPLLTHRVRRVGPPRSLPRSDEYRTLATAAGLTGVSEAPAVRALPQESALAEGLLGAAGLAGSPYVVVAPGAAYGPAKQWGAGRFAEAAADVKSRHGLASVIVGSEQDRAVAAGVAAGLASAGVRAANLTGRTTLGGLVGLVAGARAVLSNDSGVMHLAAALGRPTVAIFGSTSPVWTSASAPWVANLYAAYPCSPCYRRTCPIGYGCLRTIEVRDAVTALDGLLA